MQLPSLPWAAQLFFAKELGRVRELNPPRFARLLDSGLNSYAVIRDSSANRFGITKVAPFC